MGNYFLKEIDTEEPSMTELEWMEMFGDNLVYMLDKHCLSQKELAEKTGISETSISNYINKRKIPGMKAIINIAYGLDCSVSELIEFCGDKIE